MEEVYRMESVKESVQDGLTIKEMPCFLSMIKSNGTETHSAAKSQNAEQKN